MEKSMYKRSVKYSFFRHASFKNPLFIAGIIIITALILMAILAPYLAPADPYKMNLKNALKPPDGINLLGTDELGRDVLSRLIYGSRVSIIVGFIVVSIACCIGVPLGAISGYYGGVIDNIIMRCVDILTAFPYIILAITIVSVTGPSFLNMIFVLGCVGWGGYARLTRGMTLNLRERDYVVAAHAMGIRGLKIIWSHILPNCIDVIIVQATFGMANAVLAASALSFLGLGIQPPTPEWGAMINLQYLRQAPLIAIAPGVAIMLYVLAINFIGDSLRDILDPHSKQ